MEGHLATHACRIGSAAGCANVPIDLGDAIAPVVIVRGDCLDRLLLQAERFELLSRHDCHSERRAAQARCDMKPDFVCSSQQPFARREAEVQWRQESRCAAECANNGNGMFSMRWRGVGGAGQDARKCKKKRDPRRRCRRWRQMAGVESDCVGAAGNVGYGGGGTCTRALGFGEGEKTRGGARKGIKNGRPLTFVQKSGALGEG